MPSRVFGTKRPQRLSIINAASRGLSGEVYDLRRDTDEAFSQLEAEISAGKGEVVVPSGQINGVSDTTRIQAILNQGKWVRLVEGQRYYQNAPLVFKNGSGLLSTGEMPAYLQPVFTGVGGASNRDNAVLVVKGEVTNTVTTTPAADILANSLSATFVGSIPTSMAGKFLRIKGKNPQFDFTSDSSDNIVSELVEISSSHTNSTTAVFSHPTQIHHDSLQSVVSIEPVVNVMFSNIYLDIPDSNTSLAVGILIQDAIDVYIHKFHARNLSHAIFNLYGAKSFRSNETWSHGRTNCGFLIETSHSGFIHNVNRTSESTRTHPLGYPQPEITMRAHCVGVFVDGGHIENSVGGIRMWGGINTFATNLNFNNLACQEACERDPEFDPYFGSSNFGIVFDAGPGRVTGGGERSAEFGFGCGISNIKAVNVRARNRYGQAGGTQPAIYFHDTFNCIMTNVTVENIGADPTHANGVPCSGMLMSDCSGTIQGMVLRGVDVGMITQNVRCNVEIDGLIMSGGAGNALDAFGGPAFVFAHDGGKSCSPQFGTVKVNGFGGSGVSADDARFRFVASFTGNPDRDMAFEKLITDTGIFRNVRPASVPAFSFGPGYIGPYAGQIGSYKDRETQPTDVIVATGPSDKNVVFVDIPHNGWGLIALGDAEIYAPANTKQGDILISGTDGFPVLAPGNAPPTFGNWYQVTGQYFVSSGKAQASPRSSTGIAETINRITTAGQTLVARGVVNLLSASATTATLPLAASFPGQVIVVKKMNIAGDVTINRSGSDTIDNATSYTLSGSYGNATFISDSTNNMWIAFPGV